MDDSGNSENALQSEENGINEPAAVTSDCDLKHSLVNGLTNGYDKEKKEKEKTDREKHDKEREKVKDKHTSKEGDRDKHRDKHKDHKDRDREKDRHKDKEREKDRDKSKHSSSSSSKDKHHSSSSSSKDRDKDKERKDKERSKHHDDKERKDKDHKSSSSSKDKEHKSSSSSKHSSSSSSKPSSSSSLSKDKEHRDKEHRDKERKDKERDKEKDKSHDKDKERSKEKHSSSTNKDKDRHSSDKHRSDKDKHRSSSSKDKDRHSSDKKNKDKEKDKGEEKEIKKEPKEIKFELPEIKEEKDEEFSLQTSIKDESMDDDDEGKLMIKEEPTDDESKMDFTETSVKQEPEEEEDEDDLPMAARIAKMKTKVESESDDDVPLSARSKPKKPIPKKRKKQDSDEDEEDDFKPKKKKKVKKEVETKRKSTTKQEVQSPTKRKKKEEEEQEVWKWWEEEKKPDGVKWTFLEHKGPVFAPDYEPLPENVKFYYKDKEMKLSTEAEEVATFYARMLEHDYTTKEAFNKNFMNDWRGVMTKKEREIITDLSKCNFKHMHAYFVKKSEERKAMSKEEKKAIKEENEKLAKEYGFCMIDGHKEKIGNFRIEPPGLFRGRGEHPKMGKLKCRVVAEDIIINCSKGSKIPEAPPGHRWKEVRHDNTVTWLASWTENVQGQVKYIMLNPSSKLKGEKDWQKYETARKLAKSIDQIREDYTADWRSKEMRIRQRAVAMYFIDKLALRAGNEKDEDQADTVGCCSLRVEHIKLHEEKDGKENVVVFDFLGKDSIRYYNEVPVEKRVFKNLVLFMENKKGEDDLFDRLNTSVLNKHLSDLMEGLTAKVFRTYNASWTLQNQLRELTDPDASEAEMILAYNRANRAVAILCNHQRAVPKTHDKSMNNLREKLANKREAVQEAEKNYKHAKRDAKNGSAKGKINLEKAKKTLERLREQLLKLEVAETDKEENKTIALGTSKLNYLDPRISVAWCKKFNVPIEKIYNKTQRDKFRWAIDMATADYVF